ncbi:MAG: YqeG family HAD IIIA-type phosphatase [Oscillospiraceae bacterium]|nr:YqeG family HAD IIIA-type phosphatase [Oscillospiraceae bacterium]
MSFLPIADAAFYKLSDIRPEYLTRRGIRLLLLDIDNTLSPYGTEEPTDEIKAWVSDMKNAGIKLFFVSNNHGERPSIFSEKLDIPYIKSAGKPSRRGALAAMERCACSKNETALVGDQSYTDVLCAKRCGITAILVRPIDLKSPHFAVRYFFELPFRIAAKEKHGRCKR